jgi:restriction endonuclease S subunit
MAQISIIQKSDIIEAGRFDAEYFKPEYLRTEKIIENLDWGYFDKPLVEITGGNAFKSEDFGGGSVKIAKITEVSQQTNVENWNTISYNGINSFPEKTLKKGDILFSGTHHNYWDIGKVIFIDFENIKSTFNQRVFRIRFGDKINSYFGYILLKTIFLRNQIEKLGRGNNQLNLNYSELNKFKIPILNNNFQLSIEKIVKDAHEKQAESKQLYQQAGQLLLTELGLLNYQPKNKLTFDITKDDIQQAQRFDAEYFQPKYADIIKKIENYSGGFDVVKNIFSFNKKNFFPDDSDFYNYVPLSKVSKSGEITITNKELGKELPTRARRLVKEGEVILSSISGSLETSAIMAKEHNNFIVSNGFYVFSSKKINSEALLILFKSKIMLEILQRISKGAILGGYDLTSFEKIKIPLIKSSVQIQIADKITQSHILRKQSKQLLEMAKLKVEQEIEKGVKKC